MVLTGENGFALTLPYLYWRTGFFATVTVFPDLREITRAVDSITMRHYAAPMIFGAHCSTAGGVHMALRRAQQIGASLCQLFVKNNMQWLGRPYTDEALKLFAAEAAQCGLRAVFGHTGYLINLGAPPSVNRDKSLQSLIQEIELAAQLGLPFLVLHPGAHLGQGEAAGLRQIVRGLDEACRATRRSRVRLALENTAGQGTCLGNRVEHLAALFDGVCLPERLGLCLDTAHFLAAGFDIRTPAGWETAISQVDHLIGVKQILAFHLNDSKADLGSRIDRHEHIGRGKIGLAGFRAIVNDPRFETHPACLETAKSEDLHEDVENLRVLRSLVEGPPVRPPRRGGTRTVAASAPGRNRPRRRAPARLEGRRTGKTARPVRQTRTG